MTFTLKKQLGLWFGGALVCVAAFQSARVLAQPEEKYSAEEASRRFGLWINGSTEIRMRSTRLNSLLTRQNQQDLNDSQLDKLLVIMAEDYAAAAFKSQTVSDKSGKTIVRLIPLQDHPGREFVCVREDGGYKVDIVTTYGHWHKLGGTALAERIFDKTGAILPNLPRGSRYNTSICQSNLKQLGLGFMQYVQDYDERLPPVRGWSEAITPYLASRQIFNCPSVRPVGNGYAYNDFVALKYLPQIVEVSSAVTFFDSRKVSANATGGQSDISNRHQLTSSSGANIAFADGHVKFIGSGYKWNDRRFTFHPELSSYTPPQYPAFLPGSPPAP